LLLLIAVEFVSVVGSLPMTLVSTAVSRTVPCSIPLLELVEWSCCCDVVNRVSCDWGSVSVWTVVVLRVAEFDLIV